MGTKSTDQRQANISSAAANRTNDAMTANASTAQNNANSMQHSLYGTYNPATNSYSGGSESGFLDPSKLNQDGLSGTYANQYNNASNQLATDTQHAVGTTMQNMASRGMGATPNGFAADQERKAYQDEAATRGNLYTGAADAQHQDATNNYWNATHDINAMSNTNQGAATSNNGAAAGNSANLYGTASQQKQTGWGAALGAVGGLASAAAGAYAGR